MTTLKTTRIETQVINSLHAIDSSLLLHAHTTWECLDLFLAILKIAGRKFSLGADSYLIVSTEVFSALENNSTFKEFYVSVEGTEIGKSFKGYSVTLEGFLYRNLRVYVDREDFLKKHNLNYALCKNSHKLLSIGSVKACAYDASGSDKSRPRAYANLLKSANLLQGISTDRLLKKYPEVWFALNNHVSLAKSSCWVALLPNNLDQIFIEINIKVKTVQKDPKKAALFLTEELFERLCSCSVNLFTAKYDPRISPKELCFKGYYAEVALFVLPTKNSFFGHREHGRLYDEGNTCSFTYVEVQDFIDPCWFEGIPEKLPSCIKKIKNLYTPKQKGISEILQKTVSVISNKSDVSVLVTKEVALLLEKFCGMGVYNPKVVGHFNTVSIPVFVLWDKPEQVDTGFVGYLRVVQGSHIRNIPVYVTPEVSAFMVVHKSYNVVCDKDLHIEYNSEQEMGFLSFLVDIR